MGLGRPPLAAAAADSRRLLQSIMAALRAANALSTPPAAAAVALRPIPGRVPPPHGPEEHLHSTAADTLPHFRCHPPVRRTQALPGRTPLSAQGLEPLAGSRALFGPEEGASPTGRRLTAGRRQTGRALQASPSAASAHLEARSTHAARHPSGADAAPPQSAPCQSSQRRRLHTRTLAPRHPQPLIARRTPPFWVPQKADVARRKAGVVDTPWSPPRRGVMLHSVRRSATEPHPRSLPRRCLQKGLHLPSRQ